MMTVIKDMQGQLGNIANFINFRQSCKFSSKTKMNSREHVNAITLNSGKQLECNHFDKSEKNDKNRGNNE